MGRKIPVRKHRGIKDPVVQMARRNACASINAAPSNPAEQELPKSVLEIQRLCSIAENSCKSEKKRKKSANDKLIDTRTLFDKEPKFPGMNKKDKGFPRIVQKPGENDEAFMHRFSAAAQDFINEVELENKFEVKFEKTNQKDAYSIDANNSSNMKNKSDAKKRKLNETIDATPHQVTFTSKRGKRFKTTNFENTSRDKGTKPNKRKRQKMKKALLKREEHHENNLDSAEEIDFDCLKDDVKFGEVVHRPPQFTAKPRGSQLNSKPGTKDLLLKEMMVNNKQTERRKSNKTKLSNAQKYFMEKERLRVVQAYRDLKASKLKKL